MYFQDMLECLYKYKQDIATMAHCCENLSNTSPEPTPRTQSALTVQAIHVNNTINQATDQLEAQLSRLRESIVQMEAIEKMKAELEAWITNRTMELKQMKDKPAKLHVEAAELELSHLEVSGFVSWLPCSVVLTFFFLCY